MLCEPRLSVMMRVRGAMTVRILKLDSQVNRKPRYRGEAPNPKLQLQGNFKLQSMMNSDATADSFSQRAHWPSTSFGPNASGRSTDNLNESALFAPKMKMSASASSQNS